MPASHSPRWSPNLVATTSSKRYGCALLSRQRNYADPPRPSLRRTLPCHGIARIDAPHPPLSRAPPSDSVLRTYLLLGVLASTRHLTILPFAPSSSHSPYSPSHARWASFGDPPSSAPFADPLSISSSLVIRSLAVPHSFNLSYSVPFGSKAPLVMQCAHSLRTPSSAPRGAVGHERAKMNNRKGYHSQSEQQQGFSHKARGASRLSTSVLPFFSLRQP